MGRKGYCVAGCLYGDEGKGLATSTLCREYNSDLVIRYTGGPQASHTVVLDDGREHRFSQFGSGTFFGCRTWLSRHVLVEPFAMANEADTLSESGVHCAMRMMSIHPDCVIITPWHWMLNQIREVSRGDQRHGSCGMGIGETRRTEEDWGLSLTVGLVEALDRKSLVSLLNELKTFLVVDAVAIPNPSEELVQKMEDEDVHKLADFYKEWVSQVFVSSAPALDGNTVILEGAQGVLLDEKHGFAPYNTWSNTTFKNALDACKVLNLEPVKVGVFRTYMTRHGAGPFVTEDKAINFPDHNKFNTWQGEFRQGHFDMVMAKYAVEVCGGLDEIFLTHMDRVGDWWQWCNAYEVSRWRPSETMADQIGDCRPNFVFTSNDYVASTIASNLNAPVKYEAYGPKASDVIVRDLKPAESVAV